MRDSAYNYKLTESGALHERWKGVTLRMQRMQGAAILYKKVLQSRRRTLMTRIRRIFTDMINPCASVSSVQSVFYRNAAVIDENNEPQMNADERRYLTATDFIKVTHRKGRKERKAVQQKSLCPLCPLWLNVFSAPAHERAPPAVHARLSGAGDEYGGRRDDENLRTARRETALR